MVKHGIISTNFKAFAGVDTMDEFIKELDPNLDYLEHKIIGNEVVIENRKFFCDNPDCGFTTFAERFDFLAQKGKKTKRLIEKIVDVSLNTSSTTASRTLKNGIADVGKNGRH